MNLFKLLTKVYLLRLLKDMLLAALIGVLVAIFFGFFSEVWFVGEAFWAFFISTAIFATRRYWLDRKIVKPFDDVINIFNPKASEAQRKRGLEFLQKEAEQEADFDEDEEDIDDADIEEDDEEETRSPAEILREAKQQAETILKILIKHRMLKNSPELLKRAKVFFKDYDVVEYGLDTEEFIEEMLRHRAFSWGREALVDMELKEYYAHIFKCVSSKELKLELKDLHNDSETHQVTIELERNGEAEKWQFTQYHDEPPENILIHLMLLLKEHGNYRLHWGDRDEWAEAIALPYPLIQELREKTDFELGEIL